MLEHSERLARKTPLSNAGWTTQSTITDGDLCDSSGENCAWTPAIATNATQISATHSNLVFLETHGGIFSGQSDLCLRDCYFGVGTEGGTSGWGTQLIPNAWKGPTWLVMDACDVTQPGAGWESKFGGNLHGILGHDVDAVAILGGMHNGKSSFQTLTGDIIGYAPAVTAWQDAIANSLSDPNWSYLIPGPNINDSIEAPGGPHFGPNGSTVPAYGNSAYMHCCTQIPDVTIGAPNLRAASNSFTLIPESVDETALYNQYGGSSVPSKLTHPNNNTSVYRNPFVTVRHYVASGGISVNMGSTGSAAGFGGSDAYAFAVSYINSNGGLPGGAVLTFAGAGILGGKKYPAAPSTANPTLPYPTVRHYTFIWRHHTGGVIAGDKIQVDVDDDGMFEHTCNENDPPNNKCWITSTWDPSFHVSNYVRVWRSIGTAITSNARHRSAVALGSYRKPKDVPNGLVFVGNALCATSPDIVNSVAEPCLVYETSDASTAVYYDAVTGSALAGSEPI